MVLIACMAYCANKPPLFYYTTSLSYADALLSYNESYSFIKLFLRKSNYNQGRSGVVSIDAYHGYFASQSLKVQGGINQTFALNDNQSSVSIYIMPALTLFAVPALAACLYSFNTMRSIDTGQMDLNAVYGEHGVKDNIGWEVVFWFLVWMQHFVIQMVLCSPVSLQAAAGNSGALTLCLLLFCTLAVNQEGDSASRRFEGPVFIALCLLYFSILSQSKVVVSSEFTYLIWFANLICDSLLLFGHLADNPTQIHTVMNCRWVYVVATCWVNVVLYIAY